MSNRNTIWSQIFVDELARAGLKQVCIAPGSRSTSLTLAFAQHPHIQVYTHLDERSAAFFALGLALASDEPAALLCTSGTAAANFFPAIVEAHESHVPLLVITSDRPAELRHSGANQTIDQVKLYGDYALWSVDAALPEADPPAIAVRNLRTLAARAIAKANGHRKGVVHINMPFRKPLEPTPVEGDNLDLTANPYVDNRPFTLITHGEIHPTDTQIAQLVAWIQESPRGFILCGPNATKGETESYQRLSAVTGYPILAEPTSGLRFTPTAGGHLIAGHNSFDLPQGDQAPDIILHYGEVPTGNTLLTYLGQIQPKHRVRITGDSEWRDDQHLLTAMICADPPLTNQRLCTALEQAGFQRNTAWTEALSQKETLAWQGTEKAFTTGDYFDGAAVYDVVDLIPAESTLFTGNSLAIRHLDQFAPPQSKRLYAYANRGVSGIDGNISTALGAGAIRPDQPLVAILGDITFYHDMNGLLAVKRCGIPITIVLLNNNGGGIFHRLPIRNHEPEFTDLFLTPHGLDFEPAIRMYGLDYQRVTDRDSFRQAFAQSVNQRSTCVIELRSDSRHDNQRRLEVMQTIHTYLKNPHTEGES